MDLVIDMRESSLMDELKNQNLEFKQENLTIGDVLIKKADDETPLLLIERKTVRDLVASLKDGRYHDQRRRWMDFLSTYSTCKIAVWIEGDLVGCHEMDEMTRSSLLNSLFRLQSKRGILVHQIKNTRQFVKSLQMVLDKFKKDPFHLLPDDTSNTQQQILDLKPFKKTADVSPEMFWTSMLCLVPGLSQKTANAIVHTFPTLESFMQDNETNVKLEHVMVGQRKLGKKMTEKILRLLKPANVYLDDEEIKKKIINS